MTAGALGIRFLLDPVVQDRVPYAPFYISLTVVAHYCGLGPALTAMALGAVAGSYFAPPQSAGIKGLDHQIGLALYLLVSAVILRAYETQRKSRIRAEAAQSTLAALLEHVPEGIAIADAEGQVQTVSRFGAEIAGGSQKDYEGVLADEQATVWRVLHLDGKTPARWDEIPVSRAVRLGETVQDEEWVLRRKDGALVPILVNATPIRNSRGRITGALVVWRDITQRKEIEEQLRESAKRESLGVLAGGVAHDFNNLLTSIMGYGGLIEESQPPGSQTKSYARAIVEAAHTAARLTQQLLAYSGRSRFILEPIDLSDLLRRMSELIHASALHVPVETDLADDLPLVEGDAAQLKQLVVNLVLNAAEAIGVGGGRIRIETRAVELDALALRGLAGGDRASPGLHVVLEVSDTGSGMDPTVLARIFDPFFTTKFTGRGLGLSAALGIVRSHSGGIKVKSAPGEGTTFQVFLPGRPRAAR